MAKRCNLKKKLFAKFTLNTLLCNLLVCFDWRCGLWKEAKRWLTSFKTLLSYIESLRSRINQKRNIFKSTRRILSKHPIQGPDLVIVNIFRTRFNFTLKCNTRYYQYVGISFSFKAVATDFALQIWHLGRGLKIGFKNEMSQRDGIF